MMVSSTSWLPNEPLKHAGKSLISTRSNSLRGPKIEPWGTHLFTGRDLDVPICPVILTPHHEFLAPVTLSYDLLRQSILPSLENTHHSLHTLTLH